MASASSLLSEEHFLCSICLDVLTDPITIPCGHNYCKTCITRYWDTNDECHCPLCRETFDRRPKASVNTFISEMVHQFRSHKWKEEYEAKTEAEVRQMIQDRQVKIQEVERSVEISKKEAFTVIADSVQIVTALTICIERSHAELIGAIEEKQKTTEKQSQGFIKELRKEITLLEKRCSELKQLQLSHTGDHLHLLQNVPPIDSLPPNKDWANVNVHPSSYTGTVRTAVAQLEKALIQEMEKNLGDVELRRIQKYAVDVTLDPDTAHCELVLSEDGKVHHGGIKKNLPNNKERFSKCPNVLGKQSFSSGRFYYEVQVKGKTAWDLGVARESINRKGQIKLRTDNGYWTIRYTGNGNVRQTVQIVGVFVDYEERLVSFYDVETRVHIYSFTGCTFTEKLYPFFSPCLNCDGRNSAPLIIISPVNMGADLGREDGNMSPPTAKRSKT